jgi:hypothetical protein
MMKMRRKKAKNWAEVLIMTSRIDVNILINARYPIIEEADRLLQLGYDHLKRDIIWYTDQNG